MDRFAKLVIAALLACGGIAHAGYAQLASPPGFSTGSGGFGYAAAANDKVFGRVIHQPNGLTTSVAGRAVTMPVSYRLAANAPRIAAQAIFLHPGIRTAVGIAAWLGASKLVWDETQKIWRQSGDPLLAGDRVWYFDGVEHPSPDAACSAAYAKVIVNPAAAVYAGFEMVGETGANCLVSNPTYPHWAPTIFSSVSSARVASSQCPTGWTKTPAGCLSPAVQQPAFEELLNPNNQPGWPMPSTVPLELPPGTPLPVEQPFINPAPGPSPAHRPQFVPTGNPVPNPNYDPSQAPGPANQPYLQPGVRIVPPPTPNSPWQVDMQPVDRPVDSPDPNPDPQPDPDPGEGDKPKPEEQQSLCEKHPDILACQKLDTPDDVELPNSEKPISITPDGGWGADNAACPAPRVLTVQGRQIPIPFDLFCTYMSGIRPIVIAMAWLSAAFILLGARESNG